MSAMAKVITAFEGAPLPDTVRRAAVRLLVDGARRNLSAPLADVDAAFARDMADHPIAEHVQAANDQHYELPSAFFERVLGPHLKYSSCLYPTGEETLEEAEALALHETSKNADLADGQHILELGCGWGSFSLWMAEVFPNAKITSVSNSASQRTFIEGKAKARGLGQSYGRHLRHERLPDRRALRPRGLGGDVRAHGQLARLAWPGAGLAQA